MSCAPTGNLRYYMHARNLSSYPEVPLQSSIKMDCLAPIARVLRAKIWTRCNTIRALTLFCGGCPAITAILTWLTPIFLSVSPIYLFHYTWLILTIWSSWHTIEPTQGMKGSSINRSFCEAINRSEYLEPFHHRCKRERDNILSKFVQLFYSSDSHQAFLQAYLFFSYSHVICLSIALSKTAKRWKRMD